jgi:protease II
VSNDVLMLTEDDEHSYVVPPTWYSVDLGTGEWTLLRRQPVRGYQPGQYVKREVPRPRGADVSISGHPRLPR